MKYVPYKKYFVALTQNCFRPEMRMRKSARAMLTSAISREFRNPSFYDEIRAESATACNICTVQRRPLFVNRLHVLSIEFLHTMT